MLAASARFCSQCGEAIHSVGEPTTRAEHRQLTVAFVDLAGSTELSGALDTEAFRNVILTYQKVVTTAIEGHGGYVARFFGDGVLAYFGYPKAHENDAEQAVNAGLAIVDSVKSLDLNVELAVRVGIMTGPAVVGDIVGDGASQEATALGEAPNIAARLQNLAQRNQVVIGDHTKEVVDGFFEFEDLGAKPLKGVSRNVTAFRVSGSLGASSRFERSLHRGLSPLVGRRQELDLLNGVWQTEAENKTVAIVADAGVGKSRLIHEFCARLDSDQAFFLRAQCVNGAQLTPFGPYKGLLRQAFQIEPDDENYQEKISRGLQILGLSLDDHLPYLLNLLGDAPQSVQGLDAEVLGTRTFQALQRLLSARCARSRVVLVVEDLHWIDQRSEELLHWVVTDESLTGWLSLLSYRPQYHPVWDIGDPIQIVALAPLSHHSTEDLIRVRLGGSLSEATIALITQKTDGNPLFAEEMANYLLRQDSEELDSTSLPANLESLLLDRIDRLHHDTKGLLQAAAVVGRDFSMDELERVSHLNGQVPAHLQILEQQDLVFPESHKRQYRFKHALVRDAVYANLLRTDREEIHLRIAESLEAANTDRIQEVADQLAEHYGHTDRKEKTAHYLAMAGKKSLALYALEAADIRFNQVLKMDREHPGCVNQDLRAQVVLQICRVYYFQFEFNKIIALVDAYLPLIEALGDEEILSRFLGETGYAHVFAGRQDIGRPLLERALSVAESINSEEGIGYASMGLIWHYVCWGEPNARRPEMVDALGKRALEIGKRMGDVWLTSKTMLAVGIGHGNWRNPADKQYWDDQLLALAEETGDHRTRALAFTARAYTEVVAGSNFAAALDYAEEAVRSSVSPVDKVMGQLASVLAKLLLGKAEESFELLVRLRKEAKDKGFVMGTFLTIEVPYAFALLARGEFARSVAVLERQMRRFTTLGEATAAPYGHLYLGQIYKTFALSKEKPEWRVVKHNLGFLLRTLPFADRLARKHLQRALDEARRLRCVGIEVVILVQLIELHQAKGRANDAEAYRAKARALVASLGAEEVISIPDSG